MDLSIETKIDPDLGFVEKPGGTRVSLTASERRVLQLLVANPFRLLTRNQILDAVSEPGSDKSDRNVDFLINRLRRKLSDDARKPKFIATRYGEGYIWIARPGTSRREIEEAHVVVGPVLGLDARSAPAELKTVTREITSALSRAFGPETKVLFAPDCPPAAEFGTRAPTYSAELAFFNDNDRTSCVVTLRDFRSGRAEAARRFRVDDLPCADDRLGREMEALIDQGWLSRIERPLDREPLTVSTFAATVGRTVPHRDLADVDNRKMFRLFEEEQARSRKSLQENERRLRNLLDETPNSAELKLMLAVTIHSKYVIAGPTIFASGHDTRSEDEDEIETLVTEALPYVRARPEHVIIAGKLLHFLQRGYEDLGRELCENAYAESVSVASSLSVIGQMRAFFGETEKAVLCLDQALNFSEPGSHAYLYALIIKCQALAAAGDWDALKSARRELSRAHRTVGFVLGPLFSEPGTPSIMARAAVFLLPRRKAMGMVMHAHYVGARLFSDPAHGTNLMTSLTGLIGRRHGRDAVPEEVMRHYPDLWDKCSRGLK